MTAPKPHCKDDKFEDGKQPSNFVESSKPSLHYEKFEKECQPPKDVENQKNPCSKNLLKEKEKLDRGHRLQELDENYGKASGVPYWVNTRCDYEVCIKGYFKQPIESRGLRSRGGTVYIKQPNQTNHALRLIEN